MVYCNSTWINTVIFGIPIYVALFGPQFAVFPIFASISSFFFQLPLQLILFELDKKIHPQIPTVAVDTSLDALWALTEVQTKELRLVGPWIPRLIVSIIL